MNESEILDKAADYIDTHGWNQGDYENEDGGVCLAGAVWKVMLPNSRPFKYHSYDEYHSDTAVNVLRKVDQHITKVNRAEWPSVPEFNDAPERTQGEVTDLLRTVAKELRA